MTAAPRKKKATPEVSDEEFVYETPSGSLTLPNFAKALNAAELRKLRQQDQIQLLFYVLERDNEDNMDAIDKALESLDMLELADVVTKWQEHARVGMGESSAS